MIRRADIVTEARRWLGTPFRHQGRARGRGVDCIGLVACVLASLGIDPRDRTDYGRTPQPGRLLRELAARLEPVPGGEAGEGDVLVLRIVRDPQHLAILTGEATIIHAYEPAGRVVEHGFDVRWRRRLVSAWRVPGAA